MTEPLYSLIVPIYKNEVTLPVLLESMLDMSTALEGKLEVVYVVDGSPDQCYSILKNELPKHSFPSQLLLHSRNYGSFAAIRIGMKCMRGQYMAVMAADLQEPPELAIEFFRSLERDEADVVVVGVFSLLIVLFKLAGSFATPGYSATIVTILFFGSLNVIGIGIVGAYLWRSYNNTMGRPLAIQMKHHSFDGNNN